MHSYLADRHVTLCSTIQLEMAPGLLHIVFKMCLVSRMRFPRPYKECSFSSPIDVGSHTSHYRQLVIISVFLSLLQPAQNLEYEQVFWCCWSIQLPGCWLVQDHEEDSHSRRVSRYPHHLCPCSRCRCYFPSCQCRLEGRFYRLCLSIRYLDHYS